MLFTPMVSPEFVTCTLQERPDLLDAVQELCSQIWPDFMVQDPIVNQYWSDLYRIHPDFQFVVVDNLTGSVIGVGNSLPVAWHRNPIYLPDEGVDWALSEEFMGQPPKQPARTQIALQIVVKDDFRGKGISSRMIQNMMEIGKAHGLTDLFAPVRPTQKSSYPLIPMERYIQWKNDNGLPLDAWIRVHHLLGAKIVKVCAKSLQISGTISEWESWTRMRFPESGLYVVPGALVPVEIDCGLDQGLYTEPNVWMHHTIK